MWKHRKPKALAQREIDCDSNSKALNVAKVQIHINLIGLQLPHLLVCISVTSAFVALVNLNGRASGEQG